MNTEAVLDSTFADLRCGAPVSAPMDRLIAHLDEARRQTSPNDFPQWVKTEVREHPAYRTLLEDPFTLHSAVQPRGYPGDAELLDFIYGSANVRPHVDTATSLGRRLYEYTRSAPASSAVRYRLALAASEVDRLAATGSRPHVLSIACGHLREAQSLLALQNGTVGRFVAVDQDPLSLELVRREWSHRSVEALEGSALSVIRRGPAELGRFDFIYALGLYDYLSDETGRRLAKACVDMLKPGGRVWIANYLEDLPSSGYMEAVMDWWLVYRSEAKLETMAEDIDAAKLAGVRTFREPAENVAILELMRV